MSDLQEIQLLFKPEIGKYVLGKVESQTISKRNDVGRIIYSALEKKCKGWKPYAKDLPVILVKINRSTSPIRGRNLLFPSILVIS